MKDLKKIFTAGCFILLFLSTSSAQGYPEGGIYVEHFQLGYKGQEQFGGIFHFPLGDKFTLNYQAGIGIQQGGGLYAHAPAGAVAGAFLLSQTNGAVFNYLGVLLFCVPNGVGMYFGKGKIMQHISIDPLDLDYWHRSFPYEDRARMSGSIVYRLKMRTTLPWPIYVAPQVSATMIYYTAGKLDQYGFRAGICIGYEGMETPDVGL